MFFLTTIPGSGGAGKRSFGKCGCVVNDFDRAARYVVKNGPQDALRWLLPRLPASLRYSRWLDAQSAPRPGEPDRRCDTIMELDDQAGQPWACVVELFTEPDSDAIDGRWSIWGDSAASCGTGLVVETSIRSPSRWCF